MSHEANAIFYDSLMDMGETSADDFLERIDLPYEEPERSQKPERLCEHEYEDGALCASPATTEWRDDSEYADPMEFEPSLATTDRCAEHPPVGKEYTPHDIYSHEAIEDVR